MIHFRWQNLNDGKIKKRHLHGRCWLDIGKLKLALEWVVPSFGLGVTIQTRAIHIKLPVLGAFFLGDDGDWHEREFRIDFHRDRLAWSFWAPRMDWSASMPKWRAHSFYFIDWLLGGTKHSSNVLESKIVSVPMHERSYSGKADLRLDSWKRPRWPFASRMLRVTIDMDKDEQIPTMDKGESDWDCGDDATYGITVKARTIDEGVASLVGSVLEKRRKYSVLPSVSGRSDG